MPRSYTDPKSYDDNHRTWLTQEELQERAQKAGIPVEPFTLADGREGFNWTGEPEMRMSNAEILGFIEEKEASGQAADHHSTLLDRLGDKLRLW